MSVSVLCAVDISNRDQDVGVLRQAARMADLDSARLDVMTVLPDFGETWVSGFFEKDHHDRAIEAAHAQLVRLCTDTLGEERNASIRHVVATGTAYKEILKVAEAAQSDLIVVGAHKPDLRDYLLGPNASRVVRHAPVSVFVVRD